MKKLAQVFLGFMMLFSVGCKPTYKQETFKESIKMLAQKEYQLDVDVKQVGQTLGVRFAVKNLLTELYSGDESIYKKMNGLFSILARVALSADVAPQFIVLDIVDADNPDFRLVFTRYEEDLRKSMAEAISYTQTQDRLLEEFVIAGRHVPFDAQEMDLVRLMMMAIDSNASERDSKPAFELEEVKFKKFVARVAENTLRRMLREKKEVNKAALLREINANFDKLEGSGGHFNMLIDLVSKGASPTSPAFIEETVLPFIVQEIKELFKSYRFQDFSGITVIEKNTGKILIVPGT